MWSDPMQFRLRTLLIVLAVAPAVIGGPIGAYLAIDRWVKGEYTKMFKEKRERERADQKASPLP